MHRQTTRKQTIYRVSFFAVFAAVTAAFVIACGGGGEPTNQAAVQPRVESGDGAAAKDTSGRGGTLRIAMSAGNIPIPDQFVTEGGEGVRFVRVNIYDCLLN